MPVESPSTRRHGPLGMLRDHRQRLQLAEPHHAYEQIVQGGLIVIAVPADQLHGPSV
jgi:hypothetical protein